MVNLAKRRPLILATLEEALMRYRVTAIPASNVDQDPRANPVNWNGTWVNWMDPEPLISGFDISEKPKRIPAFAIALIAVLLGLSIIGIIVLVTVKLKKKASKEIHHPEHGNFQKLSDRSGNLNDRAILEGIEAPRKSHSFNELASLKDLARTID